MSLLNRVIALLVGAALVVVGVLALVEGVRAALGRPGLTLNRERADEYLRGLQWETPEVVLIAVALCIVGVALLALQLRRTTPSRLPLAVSDAGRRATIEGRGLVDLLQRRATQDQDVLDTAVRLRRRAARIKVTVPSDVSTDDVKARVRNDAQAVIDGVNLRDPVKPRVSARQSGGGAS